MQSKFITKADTVIYHYFCFIFPLKSVDSFSEQVDNSLFEEIPLSC